MTSLPHTSAINSLINSDIPIYFTKDFVPVNRKKQWISIQESGLIGCFDRAEKIWTSLPYAPWGSFFISSAFRQQDFISIMDQVVQDALPREIESIRIKQPPLIYQKAIPEKWLSDYGFIKVTEEINQHVDLSTSFSLHEMEKRKLAKSQGKLVITRTVQWESGYQRILEWRADQQIPLNISWEHLKMLIEKFPESYDCWEVLAEGRVVSMCICIRVTREHCYYFLPATNPALRSLSPMVALIASMADHYKKEGFTYFDLGQSSINGQKQDGLYTFKKRMGAQESLKTTYDLDLTTRS